MNESDKLEQIPGVGKSIAKDLRDIGINQVNNLINSDPQKLYNALCKKRNKTIDKCVLYVFRCAVYFAENETYVPELLKWWNWRDQNKLNKSRKFKLDGNFIPCPALPNDELFPNGIFVFNISEIIAFIKSNPKTYNPEYIYVKSYNSNFFRINEAHMPKISITEPVILGEIAPYSYNLIDGQHRMEKARRMDIEKIKAYKIRAEQLKSFLIDKKGYLAFIDYWNNKLNTEFHSPNQVYN